MICIWNITASYNLARLCQSIWQCVTSAWNTFHNWY